MSHSFELLGRGFSGTPPTDWEIRTADDICTKVTDGTHDTPQTTLDGRPYITAIHVKNGRIDFDSCLFISESDHRAIYKRCNPQRGDLAVVNIGAGVAECGIVDVDYEFSLKNVALLKPRIEFLLPDYLLQQFLFRGERIAHSVKTGGAQPFLSLKEIRSLPIAVPPVTEQRRIAEILSTWDRAIEATEKLIANSQAQKKALMQQLLTSRKRLPGFNGEWRHVRLRSLLTEETERNRESKIARVLSVTNHSGIVLPEEHFSKRVASDDVANYKIIRKGQFAYNPSRLNVGSFARLDGYDVGILSPMYVVFSVDGSELDSNFFYAWMTTDEARQRVLSNVQGSVRDSVGFDALCGFPFQLPPLAEQVAIANVLMCSDQQTERARSSLAKLRAEKSALMQQLLTGKRRVKLPSAQEEAA